jgi:hypothetical protein
MFNPTNGRVKRVILELPILEQINEQFPLGNKILAKESVQAKPIIKNDKLLLYIPHGKSGLYVDARIIFGSNINSID